MGFENTGRVWSAQSLKTYLQGINKPAWCDSVTLHHTASPSLAQRPNGFTAQHLRNLEHYYRVTKGWSSAPHLFVDEDQLWGMCDFRKKGVHAASFNKRSIGIEVLGDYDSEAAKTGRGRACWENAAAATSVLLEWIGKKANTSTVLFHRDDPLTSKTCPGKKVAKDWVLELIKDVKSPAVAAPEKKPALPTASVKLTNQELRYDGQNWVVPVRVFLTKKGVSQSDIRTGLQKKGNFFYYKQELLEDAYYDKPTKATWVALRELEELKL